MHYKTRKYGMIRLILCHSLPFPSFLSLVTKLSSLQTLSHQPYTLQISSETNYARDWLFLDHSATTVPEPALLDVRLEERKTGYLLII